MGEKLFKSGLEVIQRREQMGSVFKKVMHA
jgi:hypothetical protein